VVGEDGRLPALLDLCVEGGLIDEATARDVAGRAREGRTSVARYLVGNGLVDQERLTALVTQAGARGGPFERLLRLPDPEHTFDSLVVFQGNEFAVEVGRHVATGFKAGYNPMYLYGAVGLGKTHILGAISNAAREAGTAKGMMFANVSDLDVEVERACEIGKRAALRDLLDRVDLLLLDDLQHCECRESLQIEIVSILNDALTRRCRVVLTCDVIPMELRGVEERLISRFGGGVVASLQAPDREARRRILEHIGGAKPLPAETLDYLAEQVTDNVRRLKSAVSQLVALRERLGYAPTVDLARAVVPLPGDLAKPGMNSDRPETAAQATAEKFKRMIESAETEEEYGIALQIAVSTRLGQLREADAPDADEANRLEKVLEILRQGNLSTALSLLGLEQVLKTANRSRVANDDVGFSDDESANDQENQGAAQNGGG
jgi:hypothetical protein